MKRKIMIVKNFKKIILKFKINKAYNNYIEIIIIKNNNI